MHPARSIVSFFITMILLTASPSSAGDLESGLITHFKFDETSGNTAYDSSVSGFDSQVLGGTQWSNGLLDGAIEFNGLNAKIDIGQPAEYSMSSYSIACWFKNDNASKFRVITARNSTWQNRQWWLTIWQVGYSSGRDAKLVFRMSPTSGTYVDLVSKERVDDNQWHAVVVTIDSANNGTAKLYLDNVLQQTITGFGVPNIPNASAYIGRDISGSSRFYKGQLDDFRIYNRALTTEEISLFSEQLPPPVYYVRKDGLDSNDGLSPKKAFKTIQHAVTKCSQPGATVYVGPGTYNEKVHIGDKNTHKGSVTGTAALPIRMIADITGEFTLGNPGAVILDGQNIENMGFEIEDVEHWTIQGFTIRNQTEYGIYIKNGAASALNCTIEVPRKYAFYAESVGSITIADCVFERDADSAHMIWIYPISNLTPAADKIIITRNDMTMKGDLYMSTGYETGWGAARNREYYNRYIYGVILYTGWRYNSKLIFDEIQITNNQISDSYLPLYSNVMSSKSLPTKVIMANNTIVGSTYSTYSNWDSNDNGIIINNIIDTCFYGTFSLNDRRAKSFLADKILENDITFLMSRYRRTFEFNIISGDPLFVDAPAGDFSLAKGSPAIDAGINLHAPEIDITGLLRPTDGNNDGVAQVDIGVSELINFGAPTKIKVVQWREISGHRDMSND